MSGLALLTWHQDNEESGEKHMVGWKLGLTADVSLAAWPLPDQVVLIKVIS